MTWCMPLQTKLIYKRVSHRTTIGFKMESKQCPKGFLGLGESFPEWQKTSTFGMIRTIPMCRGQMNPQLCFNIVFNMF
jgi:hypothetical protein